MAAATAGKRAAEQEPVDEAELIEALDELYTQAAEMVAQPRLLGTIQQWLSKAVSIEGEDENAMAMALMLAMDLEMFTPSLGGALTFDRLARRQRLQGAAAAAVAAAKQACFTPMRIRSVEEETSFVAENLWTGATIDVLDHGVMPIASGATVAARLVALASGAFKTFGPVTPLDETSLAVVLDFKRPGKRVNDQRRAAAVYRHVVRHGNPKILGFNEFLDADDDIEAYEPSAADKFVAAWIALKGEAPPETMVDAVRAVASPTFVVEAVFKWFSAASLDEVPHDVGAAFRWVAEVQMETLQRRAAAGSGGDTQPFDTILAMMDNEIALNDYPPGARALFVEARKSFERVRPKQDDDELTRVVERIRALRAKTLDQGCSEAEAIAAAAKVAELLERYGLTLSEIDIKAQACEGIGIESNRKRHAPIDDCLTTIAAFCDCKAWHETSAADTLRSVFFGLPADVEAAHYLYGRVEAAFETETRAFQAGPLYGAAQGGARRTATNSFQIGLSEGICIKLRGLKAERDGVRSSSGRDLVHVKAAVVDDELAKLGMRFTSKETKARRVQMAAYKQGEVAGRKLEAQDGLR